MHGPKVEVLVFIPILREISNLLLRPWQQSPRTVMVAIKLKLDSKCLCVKEGACYFRVVHFALECLNARHLMCIPLYTGREVWCSARLRASDTPCLSEQAPHQPPHTFQPAL
jgi:hypothetical protein